MVNPTTLYLRAVRAPCRVARPCHLSHFTNGHTMSRNAVLDLLNYLLATAMWFILGRLCLRLFIRNPGNPIWQLFVLVTEPVYAISRQLTWRRLPEQWCWLITLLWLLLARYLLVQLHTPGT